MPRLSISAVTVVSCLLALTGRAIAGQTPTQPAPPAADPAASPSQPAQPEPQEKATKAKPDNTLVFNDANCRYKPLPGWSINRQVSGTLLATGSKAFPKISFVLASEKLLPHISDSIQLDSAMSQYLLAGNGSPEFRSTEVLTLGGIAGEVAVVETGKGTRVRTAVWTGRKGDRVYRLMIERPASVADEKLIAMVKDTGAGFSLIDEAYTGDGPAPTLSGRSENPQTGCSANFSGLPGWSTGKATATLWSGGDMYRYGAGVLMACTSIRLAEHVDDETLNTGLLGCISESAGLPAKVATGKDGDIEWTEFDWQLISGGRQVPARLRTARVGERLYAALAWSIIDRPETLKAMRDVMAAVRFAPAQDDQPTRHESGAPLLNEIGINFYRKRDYSAALHWCSASFDLRADPQVLRNIMTAARDAKMFSEGLEVLNAHRAALPADDRVAAKLEAELLVGAGDEQGAADVWDRLFAGGFRDDELLEKSANTLAGANLHERALTLVDKYASNKRRFESLRPDLLMGAGRNDEAAALLAPSATEKGFNTDRAVKYIRLMIRQGRARDAVEASRLVAEKNPKNAWAWFWKGRVEEETGRLDLAKRSLQQAKELAPGEQAIAEALERVGSQLGEGDDGLIRTPIEQVAVEPAWIAVPDGVADLPGDSGYRYDYWVTALSFTPGKAVRRTTYDRSVVLDRHGAEQMSTFAFSFNPAYERLYINKCEVVSPDGKRREIDRSTFYVRTRRDASSERTLVIPVEGLTPGTAIEVVTTVEDLRPSSTPPFGIHYFADEASVGRRVVVVYAPEGTVRFEPSGVTPVKGMAGGAGGTGGASYVSFVRELCKPEASEPFNPPPESRLAHVAFGVADRTWQQEATEYLDLIKAPLDGAAAGPVAELAAKLVKPEMNLRQKVEALTNYVQREVTYKAIVFGRHAQVPETCDSTLTKRFGDCKAKSLLLHGLLTAAGVKSSLALVSTRGDFVESIADREQFNHMIVYVGELGEDGFVDPTADDAAPFITAPFGLNGRKALVLDREHARIATVRALAPQECTISVQRTVTHGPDKSTVEEAVTFSGAYAPYWREALTTRDKTEMLRLLASELEDAGVDAHVDSFSSEGERDTAVPLILRLTYTVARSGPGAPPLAWVAREREYGQLPTVQDRKTEFFIRNPMVIESVTRIRNAQFACPTQELTAKTGAVRLEAHQDKTDAVLTLRLTRAPGTYPPEEYERLRSAVNQAFAAYAQPAPASKP